MPRRRCASPRSARSSRLSLSVSSIAPALDAIVTADVFDGSPAAHRLVSRQSANVAVTRQIGEFTDGVVVTSWLRATDLGSGTATLAPL